MSNAIVSSLIDRINQTRDHPQTCMEYVMRRSKLPLLPAPRDDRHSLTSEKKMMQERHRMCVQYIERGGSNSGPISDEQRDRIENSSQVFNDAYREALFP